ncbi:hypothetical protein ACQR3W_21590 [Rhodococcus ruber]|nr:hypothetical protein [Rhodococcus ruber]MCZ4533734.1 hypothetical protein [Rhodococcus ruber]
MTIPIDENLLIALYVTAPQYLQQRLEHYYGTDILDALLRKQV